MKVEIKDEEIERIVKAWLEDEVEYAKKRRPSGIDEDDDFWTGMKAKCMWLLNNNWPHVG